MTNQEVFYKVVMHLRQQGKQSLRDIQHEFESNCAYRGKDGLKCAIGCLIKDSEYYPSMEGKGIDNLLREFSSLRRYKSSFNLLAQLQCIHDSYLPIFWELRLKNVARELNLIYTEPGK